MSSLFHISKERGREINFDLLMACGSCDRSKKDKSLVDNKPILHLLL